MHTDGSFVFVLVLVDKRLDIPIFQTYLNHVGGEERWGPCDQVTEKPAPDWNESSGEREKGDPVTGPVRESDPSYCYQSTYSPVSTAYNKGDGWIYSLVFSDLLPPSIKYLKSSGLV